jgi:hypothetical protein
MSYTVPYFQAQITRYARPYKETDPTLAANMTVMATALESDTTTHDASLQTAPGILQPGWAGNSKLHNDLALVINRGKASGLANADMAAAITAAAAAI